MGRFDGKVAVVTGGRRGIGRACALALIEYGAGVITTAKSIDAPTDIDYMQADLSDPRDHVDLIARMLLANGVNNVDILINNAGISHSYLALDYPEEEREKIWQVNYHAPVDLACQAVRLGCKRIINITSISAFNGARKISEYAATKAALTQWTKCASNEWADRGVTVNCVAPGFIETDMLKLADPATIIGRIPAGRLGIPEDVVGAVLFLASDEARYITGTTIIVDGGWLGR